MRNMDRFRASSLFTIEVWSWGRGRLAAVQRLFQPQPYFDICLKNYAHSIISVHDWPVSETAGVEYPPMCHGGKVLRGKGGASPTQW